MAKNPQFNNFTDETLKKCYLVHVLWANQEANPYGVEVHDTVKLLDEKKENASA